MLIMNSIFHWGMARAWIPHPIVRQVSSNDSNLCLQAMTATDACKPLL